MGVWMGVWGMGGIWVSVCVGVEASWVEATWWTHPLGACGSAWRLARGRGRVGAWRRHARLQCCPLRPAGT